MTRKYHAVWTQRSGRTAASAKGPSEGGRVGKEDPLIVRGHRIQVVRYLDRLLLIGGIECVDSGRDRILSLTWVGADLSKLCAEPLRWIHVKHAGVRGELRGLGHRHSKCA